MLYDTGYKGKTKGNFQYPRALAINDNGDIFVADTGNNRVQCFNSAGLLKFVFKDVGPPKLNPTGIAVLPNTHILVADSKNKRIHDYRSDGSHCYSFDTDEPSCGICCDEEYNIAITTTKQTVEIYQRRGRFVTSFSFAESSPEISHSTIAFNDRQELLIANRATSEIKFYSINGRLLNKFKLKSNFNGLSCTPVSIFVNVINQIIIADNLNHVVNLYSEKGILLQQLLGPNDSLGPVYSCSVGPEGHIVTTEFSMNGRHCFKIFRYRNCECHRSRPGSSRPNSRNQ